VAPPPRRPEGSSDAEPSPGSFVHLASFSDVLTARMLVGALEDEGVVVQAPGLHHRELLPGMEGAFVALEIRVPRADLERAQQILGQLAAPGRSDEDDTRDLDGSPREERLGATLLLLAAPFGLAHVTAGARVTGTTLFLAGAAAVGLGATICAPTLLLWPLVPLVDLVGALRIAREGAARIEGAPFEPRTPVLPFLVALLVLTPFGLQSSAPGWFIGERGRDLCALSVGCGMDEPGGCEEAIAGLIGEGAIHWGTVRTCRECIGDHGCGVVWHEGGPGGATLYLDVCGESCEGLLPGEARRRRGAPW
jgi:hypothetical protein